MTRRDFMRAAVVASFIAAAAIRLEAQEYKIGSIDLYGTRRVAAEDVRRELTFKEGDAIVLQNDADLPAYLEESERRIAMLPGVRRVRTNIVCCDDNQNIVVFVGVEETGLSVAPYRAAPTGAVRMAADVVNAGTELEAAFVSAIQRGAFGEDDSQGHALLSDPTTRAIQEKFVGFAERDLTLLREVLRDSADPAHRALAAEVLGYVEDKQGIVSDLVYAMSDPAEDVRNNAMRALMVFTRMTARPAPRVPFDPFLRLLNSPIWTDRNKASGALDGLSAARNPELLAALRDEALDSLVEMARWKSKGHAMAAFMILGRIAGISDAALHDRWSRDDRESVVAAAMKGR
jgi:hypothetical protein